jgi:hypothetical protein
MTYGSPPPLESHTLTHSRMQGLEKFGNDVQPQFAKSKTMSAKNAWGKSTGYAEKLIDQGMEKSRAQQLENWMNQQEILKQKNAHRSLTESFDKVESAGEADWRTLAKFGVERNQVRGNWWRTLVPSFATALECTHMFSVIRHSDCVSCFDGIRILLL